MAPKDQEEQPPPHQQTNPPNFFDIFSNIMGQAMPPRAGQGVDHHTTQPGMPPFSGSFPFGGPAHRGGPGPHHHPHGPQGNPHHFYGDGAAISPWWPLDQMGWYRYGLAGDEHEGARDRRRGVRRERRECRRRSRHDRRHDHHHDDEGGKEDNKDDAGQHTRDGNEKGFSSSDAADADMPDPAEVAPEDDDAEYPPPPYGQGFFGGGRGGRGGRGGGRGGWGAHHHHHHRGGRGGGGPSREGLPLDFAAMMRNVCAHPFFQNLREQAERRGGDNSTQQAGEGDSSYAPPVDIFDTERAFVVHVALPGAKKDDVGVDWNPDTNTLSIAGVTHRPGDEALIQGLVSAERRVGLFERRVVLPPPDTTAERAAVDGSAISARMEDGLLIVTVPKVEKEWTEIRKVDIQ